MLINMAMIVLILKEESDAEERETTLCRQTPQLPATVPEPNSTCGRTGAGMAARSSGSVVTCFQASISWGSAGISG